MPLFYRGLIAVGTWLQPLILVLIRLFLGYAFFQAGSGKLAHIEDFQNFLLSLHVPMPFMMAYFVAGVEAVGGVLLMLGFASRLAALILAINMVVAYLTAHSEAVMYLWTNPGMFVDQQPFLYLLTSTWIFAFGPGLFSIDALLKRTQRAKDSAHGEQGSK